MLIRAFTLLLLLFIAHTSFGQLIPISLAQRIDSASTIFEGKVISQTSHWNESQSNIYTSNIVEVYKLFKGQLTGNQVELITKGGIVGNRMERVSNTLELSIGEVGIFTAIPSKTKITTKANLIKLRAFAGAQGFIKYDLTNGSAKDVFNDYKNINRELHSKIVAQTKINIKTIQKASFKIEQ